MEKTIQLIVSFGLACVLSACVTQTYENDKNTPVVQNESSNNEIAMTRISLGLGYLKMGNTAQAKLNLEKAKYYAPKLVQVYTAFAHYYDSVGEPEQAIAAYEQALSLKGDDADTLNNYGVFLCKQARYQDAEKQILKAIAVPSYILVAQSYENLALCQLKAKDFDKAELYFDKAIQHSPTNASTLLHMVRLQYAKADYQQASALLTRYEKATRRFTADALALAYKVFDKKRNRKTAKNYGSMLVKMFPHSFEAKQYLLNGLRETEADQLARDYQASLDSAKGIAKKKRVVKLSPNTEKPVEPAQVKPKQRLVLTKEESKAPTPVSEKVSKPAQEEKVVSQEPTLVETSAKAPAGVVTEDSSAPETEVAGQKMLTLPIHIVKKGDSLFSISKKYNIHMKAIERWNGLSRAKVLKIGDVIYLANPKKLAKS